MWVTLESLGFNKNLVMDEVKIPLKAATVQGSWHFAKGAGGWGVFVFASNTFLPCLKYLKDINFGLTLAHLTVTFTAFLHCPCLPHNPPLDPPKVSIKQKCHKLLKTITNNKLLNHIGLWSFGTANHTVLVTLDCSNVHFQNVLGYTLFLVTLCQIEVPECSVWYSIAWSLVNKIMRVSHG